MYRSAQAAAFAFALTASAAASAQDAQSSAASSATRSTGSILSDSAFNPAMSLILDGTYRNIGQDPETWQIGGFIPGGEETGPGERGFGIDESELTISANIDPYFSGYFTAAVTRENEVEVEEAYIQNTGYVSGTTIKFGRFFAGFGYQNEQHSHIWDFVDLPLVHQAFFGGQLREEGIQLRYVAPTALFLEFGVEGGSGNSFPGTDRNKNGFNGGGAFVHVGGDAGVSNSYRFGGSYRKMSAIDRAYEDVDSTDTDVTNAFTGDSNLWGLDFVWKWSPNGDPAVRNFKFQTEYFQRKETGELTFDLDGVSGAGTATGSYSSKQKGWYAQAVYQFMPRWRTGVRYDQLDSGTLALGPTLLPGELPILAENKPKRTSAMVDFSPSEFSRLRVQYTRDQARFDESDNQIFVQYIMSLGAHGAHKF
jgi:hypothetical protein